MQSSRRQAGNKSNETGAPALAKAPRGLAGRTESDLCSSRLCWVALSASHWRTPVPAVQKCLVTPPHILLLANVRHQASDRCSIYPK